MRRVGVLMAVLAISMILIINPSPYIDSCTRGNEVQETSFLTAADGAESSESLTSFSSTLDDDAMYYPDGYNGSVTRGDYRNNMDDLDGWFYSNGVTSITESSEMITVNGTTQLAGVAALAGVNEPAYSTVHDDYHIVFQFRSNVTADMNFSVWMATGDNGVPSTNGVLDFTLASSDTWYTQVLNVSDGANAVESYVWSISHDTIDYIDFSFDFRLLVEVVRWNSYSGLFEDFADVSDITVSVGETVTTDGDLGTFHHPGDNAWDYYFWNAPSALAVQVIEWRCHANISTSSYEFALYSADDGGGSQLWASGSITAPTSAGTKKYSPMVTGVESIRLATRHASSPASFIFDYLRGSLSTEMGWAHDGSTTAGITNNTLADVTSIISTDGDRVTLNATSTTGAGWTNFYIDFDTTTTEADTETDYYQFVEFVNFDVTTVGCVVLFDVVREGYRFNALDTLSDGNGQTSRYNIVPTAGKSSSGYLILFAVLISAGDTFDVTFDYIKLYSIANHTVTQSGAGTDDYLYVDSGVLYSSIDDGYIELNHDPALSVSDTYSVYNLTTSGTAPEFSQYVSSWSSYSDDTRGATTSGTVTDIKLKFDGTETLSALKFIQDGTAPDIIDKYLDPSIPADDEAVTVTAVAYDAVEVYELTINAIVYPTGFSDVDYSMTETAQEHVFTYDFATLIAGYYLFQVTANDGANTYSEYISVRVREAAITISPITFFGVGEDFTQMQMSFDINKDCSYTIYETSASYAEADTHTGSVSEGWSNIAWDKISVVDTSANFSIKFENGSLSTWVNGSYSIAQTTFYVSTVTQMVSLDTVTVTGRITKLGAYQVYDDLDVLKDYGSITDLDFKIQFTRWGGYDEQNHDFAIKFTNGSQTCWYNSSFYAFKKPVVAPFQTTDPSALYAFQASFWTALAATFILIMVAIDFYKRYWK